MPDKGSEKLFHERLDDAADGNTGERHPGKDQEAVNRIAVL